MSENQLKKVIDRRKNPLGFLEQRVILLMSDIEDIKQKAKKDIKQAISDAKKDAIFKDLDPAKDVAKKVAREEIKDFKENATSTMESVAQTLETRKTEVIAEMETQLNEKLSIFEKSAEDVIK